MDRRPCAEQVAARHGRAAKTYEKCKREQKITIVRRAPFAASHPATNHRRGGRLNAQSKGNSAFSEQLGWRMTIPFALRAGRPEDVCGQMTHR
jgi:hypothetical protein